MGVVDAALKSGSEARGNADRAQHDGHGGGEILAVAAAAIEEKIGQRIGGLAGGHFERVGVIGTQMALDGAGAIEIGGGAGGDGAGQGRDARIELGQFEIASRAIQASGGGFRTAGEPSFGRIFEQTVDAVGEAFGNAARDVCNRRYRSGRATRSTC